MRAISSKDLRSNLAETLDRVVRDHEPVIVIRDGEPSAVILSLEDFKSYDETAYLLSTPANEEALRKSIAELESSGGTERTLIE